MEDLKEDGGFISRILTSKKNDKWRGYVFTKDDDTMYSVTLNSRVPEDVREQLGDIKEGDYVTFFFKPSGNFNNIYGLQLPENPPPKEKSDDKSTPSSPPTRDVKVSDIARQTLIVAQNALTNAVVLVGHKLQHGLYPGNDLEISLSQWADNEVLRLRKVFLEDTLEYTGEKQ